MKRLSMLVLVCMCVLVPTAARADDGLWLDWLFKWDPKFVGVGGEIHLLCLDDQSQRIDCENWFKNFGKLFAGRRPVNDTVDFDRIKHEIDFRIAFYWTYGSRFSDEKDDRNIYASKLMGMYHYHFNRMWQLGGGAGVTPLFGDGFRRFSRSIITPISLLYAPSKIPVLTLRFEYSYLPEDLSGPNFANFQTEFANKGEWNPSFAVGFDLRRLPFQPRPGG